MMSSVSKWESCCLQHYMHGVDIACFWVHILLSALLRGYKFMVPYLPQSEVKLSLKYTVRGLNERISLSINKYQLPAWSRDNLPPTLSHCQSIIICFPCCVNTQEAVICSGNMHIGLPFVWSLPWEKIISDFRFLWVSWWAVQIGHYKGTINEGKNSSLKARYK